MSDNEGTRIPIPPEDVILHGDGTVTVDLHGPEFAWLRQAEVIGLSIMATP